MVRESYFKLHKMKIKLIVLLSLLGIGPVLAQNTLDIVVKDSIDKEPLIGVTAVLPSLDIGAISNESGKIHIQDIQKILTGSSSLSCARLFETYQHFGRRSKQTCVRIFPFFDFIGSQISKDNFL